MLIKILLATLCLLPQVEEMNSKFLVKLENGETVFGTADAEVRLETSFGHAVFRTANIRGVNQRNGQFTIRTAEGDSLKGAIVDQQLVLKTEEGEKEINFSVIESISVVARAPKAAGKITDGIAANEMSYHLRMPDDYSPEETYNAILILHGSNMNSKAYVNTIASAWPAIAKRNILIGINGENKSRGFKPENPSYNYSYVNFVGKSTYKGYPGTDRESPALVSEVLTEIKEYVAYDKLFVGGHSQGGFFTYSVIMNYPDQVDGAFPIAGGMIFQTDPAAYDNEELRKEQRKIPLAIVHASNDRVVKFSLSESAHRAFLGDSFPMLRLITNDRSGHSFAALPIDEAIGWLERMTETNAQKIVDGAKELNDKKKFRDLAGLLARTDLPNFDENQTKEIEMLRGVLEANAESQCGDLEEKISENKSNSWIGEFYNFRNEFEFTKTAKPVLAAFEEIKKKHESPAKKIYGEARKLFQQQKRDEAYEKCTEIVETYYASSKYMTVKGWLENRDDK